MKAYAIKDCNGYIYEESIRDNEYACVYNFKVENNISDYMYKKEGYRCVPVEITEIKK